MGQNRSLQIDLFGPESASLPVPIRKGDAKPRRLDSTAKPKRGILASSDEEALVRELEETGRYRVLRQLEPRPVKADLWPSSDRSPSAWPRLGVILDTETTGLDHNSHEVIELGMVAFTYDQTSIQDVVGVYSALQQPSTPITAEITRITGITDEMVAGQRIDLGAVENFIETADLVIAHNARFDRPFCEKLAPGFDIKPWACSVAEIDWVGLGFEGTKLGYLIGQSGFFHNGHRAIDDCHALLEVLSQASRTDALPAFQQLIASAERTRLRIHAIGSPFHTKDVLKARGYRWSDGMGGKPKCWWCEVGEDAFEEELQFLEEEIYGGTMQGHIERLTACERFKG
ncbi:3'-5' exonuclease [Aureimonas sp. D3]|uniref:3'-5' exonuclease n=1 Tax=Aureimonas sp. D3 TaxID=1638164 RepID=UPI00078324A7